MATRRRADRPLTDLGREQAQKLGASLAGIDIAAAYSSDLSRAFDTARIAVADRRIVVRAVRDLRERALGSWEGLLDAEVPVLFPELYARWNAGPGIGAPDAEEFRPFAERVERGVRCIADEHPTDTVLVVAHAGPMRVLHALAAGLDFVASRRSLGEPPHATAVRYEMTGGRLRRAG